MMRPLISVAISCLYFLSMTVCLSSSFSIENGSCGGKGDGSTFQQQSTTLETRTKISSSMSDEGSIDASSTKKMMEILLPPPTSSPSAVASYSSCSRRLIFQNVAATISGIATVQLAASVFVDNKNAAYAMTIDSKTGIALPDPGEIEASVSLDWSQQDNPFVTDDNKKTIKSSLFSRLDSSPDSKFYTHPRFVEHVDDNAVQIMTDYISNEAIKDGDTVLDLCSSWTSHISPDTVQNKARKIVGLGMNAKELEANSALSDWIVQDLNLSPKLPYNDETFDSVLCQLSIDYLTRPLEVLREVNRVLKPGGKVHILFSNRLFLSKAVGLWTGADDLDHCYYVGCYLHFCTTEDGSASTSSSSAITTFENIAATDLSTRKKGRDGKIIGDPMYVVTAAKKER